MKKVKDKKQELLSALPSVDEIIKSPEGLQWLAFFPRSIVLQAVREIISEKRSGILNDLMADFSWQTLMTEISIRINKLSSYSLKSLINATGIVLHTNLGRAVLSDRALENVLDTGRCYSNLEYDLDTGSRGKRHSHTLRILQQITGAEDAIIVNNNAAAVLICLDTLAKGREVIVSRGELVEIGGSFRVPDVMSASGALLKEVGTTNKTHLFDYSRAINDATGLLLKVHQSNYKIIGFTDEVKIEELVALGNKHEMPVMYDLGSGCLIDMKPHGIHSEPTVQEIVKTGADIVTFSGDKLLGGPQGGIIVGKKEYIEKIRKNPLARALRIDKMTIAAFEATLMSYLDPETALKEIPVLHMLFQYPQEIQARAKKISAALRRKLNNAEIKIVKDVSKAGGGSLPEADFGTYAVAITPEKISVNVLEERLRQASPPVIARISEGSLLLDARTIRDKDIKSLIGVVLTSLAAD